MGIQRWLKTNMVKLVLAIIILFYIINNYLWLKFNLPTSIYLSNNSFFYFEHMIKFYDRFDLGIISMIESFFSYYKDIASVYHLSGALIAFIFKKSFLAICLLNNLIYFVIALFSIYKIGQKIANKGTGLMSALVFSLYPAIFGLSRLYVVEFAVMSIVSFSIWCLLESEAFSNRKYSILFGLGVGWGMMVKYSFLMFIIGPLIYILISTLIYAKHSFKIRFLNLVFAGLLSSLIMGSQYFDLEMIREYLRKPFYLATPSPWYAFENFRVYTIGLIEYQLSLFFFIIFLVAFFYFCLNYRKNQATIFLLWIFLPWLAFTVAPHPKSTEYVVSYLPAIALISGFGLIELIRAKLRPKQILISLIIIVGIIQYYEFSFGLGFDLDKFYFRIRGIGNIHYYTLDESVCSRPKQDNPYDKIISSITNKLGGPFKKVLLLSSYTTNLYSDPRVWQIISWAEGIPFKFMILYNFQFVDSVLVKLKEADLVFYSSKKKLDDPNYVDVVLKEYREHLVGHFKKKKLEVLDKFFEHNLENFKLQFKKLTDDFELVEEIIRAKDGTSVYLYKKISNQDDANLNL